MRPALAAAGCASTEAVASGWRSSREGEGVTWGMRHRLSPARAQLQTFLLSVDLRGAHAHR